MSLGLGFSGGGSGLNSAQKAKLYSLANNYRGVYKPQGCQLSALEGYSGDDRISKIELEAPFSRVRIWVFHRGAYGSGNYKFAVASTDVPLVDTVANCFYPTRSGVANNAYQTTSTEVGWNLVTWGSGSKAHGGYAWSSAMYTGNSQSGKIYPSTDYPQAWQQSKTDNALGDVICSDWVQCKSSTPTTASPSGYYRPFLLLRSDRIAGAFPREVVSGYQRSAASALSSWTTRESGALYSRMLYTRAHGTGDGVADVTKLPSSGDVGVPDGSETENWQYIAIEVEYDVPTRSFARFGDSNSDGYAWCQNAILSLSTPSKPLTSANFGMSSNRSIQYYTMADAVIKKGMAFTDWIIPSHSQNDANDTSFDIDQTKVQILKILDDADSIGVRVWIWTYWRGINTGVSANDAQLEEYINWIRALCASGRANIIDIAKNWIRNTYSSDSNVHPNTAGLAYCEEVAINEIRRQL